MRKPNLIDSLMPRTRQAVLAATLLQPERSWYLAELARHLRVGPSSLQRELARLAAAGVLKARREGRMIFFQADRDCPIYRELRGLLAKTAGLVDVLRAVLAGVAPRIECCFVYGSIARGEEQTASDVDLLIVGEVGLSELAAPLRRAVEKLGRDVNPKVFREGELSRRLAAKEHFLQSVLKQPKLFVYGTANELEQIIRREARYAGSVQQAGAG